MYDVTVIKERARQSLISKAMLGETMSYWEAMSLCHKGYKVCMCDPDDRDFYLKASTIKGRYNLWMYQGDSEPTEYVTETPHLFMDWKVKN